MTGHSSSYPGKAGPLVERIEAYLNDAPSTGGHSDAAGGDCWDLLREAADELAGLREANHHYRDDDRQASGSCGALVAVAKMAKAAAEMELGFAASPDFSPREMLDAANAALAAQPSPAADAQRAIDFCQWLQGYFKGDLGRDELSAFEANQIRNELNERVFPGLVVTSTSCLPAAPEPFRWPAKGDLMTFLGKNGYEMELTEALRIFKVGQQYRVLECNVQSWSHSVRFEDVAGWYNGVMFERCPLTSTTSKTGV